MLFYSSVRKVDTLKTRSITIETYIWTRNASNERITKNRAAYIINIYTYKYIYNESWPDNLQLIKNSGWACDYTSGSLLAKQNDEHAAC